MHKTTRKVKVETFDGRMEQENSSALVHNIEGKSTHRSMSFLEIYCIFGRLLGHYLREVDETEKK